MLTKILDAFNIFENSSAFHFVINNTLKVLFPSNTTESIQLLKLVFNSEIETVELSAITLNNPNIQVFLPILVRSTFLDCVGVWVCDVFDEFVTLFVLFVVEVVLLLTVEVTLLLFEGVVFTVTWLESELVFVLAGVSILVIGLVAFNQTIDLIDESIGSTDLEYLG